MVYQSSPQGQRSGKVEFDETDSQLSEVESTVAGVVLERGTDKAKLKVGNGKGKRKAENSEGEEKDGKKGKRLARRCSGPIPPSSNPVLSTQGEQLLRM